MNANFETIKRYFNDVDLVEIVLNRYCRTTAIGTFLPSSLVHIHSGLEQLIATGIITTLPTFLDAGCGMEEYWH